jgi:hypothetical protein
MIINKMGQSVVAQCRCARASVEGVGSMQERVG